MTSSVREVALYTLLFAEPDEPFFARCKTCIHRCRSGSALLDSHQVSRLLLGSEIELRLSRAASIQHVALFLEQTDSGLR